MTTASAYRIVYEHLLTQASGLRMRAKNPVVGTIAGKVEQELTERLKELEKADAQQPELPNLTNVVEDEDAQLVVNFSKQPPRKEGQ